MSRPTAPWDSQQYLRFETERTRPCRDLVARIDLDAPEPIVDLGCGPGTSTAVLAARWPRSQLTGVDSSPEMLERARAGPIRAKWISTDLRDWSPDRRFGLVFSNAALHWLPDHRSAIPRCFAWVATGGALAFQVPARPAPPPPWVRALDTVRKRPAWVDVTGGLEPESNVLSLEQYYDLLSPEASRLDLWDTEYHHVLGGPEEVVEWIRATALRPWLARLLDDAARAHFLSDLTAEVARRYPRRPDGRVIFPFLRRFVVAYR